MSKAFIVRDDDSGRAEIVFHEHRAGAQRLGAAALETEFESVRCERAARFDAYAEQGRVPASALVRDFGWWIACGECGRRIDADHDDDDEFNTVSPDEMVEEGDAVYCSPACRDAFHRRRKEAADARNRFAQELQERFPGISIVRVFGDERNPPEAFFTFPGGRVTVRASQRDRQRVAVDRQDLDAWKAYTATLKKEAG